MVLHLLLCFGVVGAVVEFGICLPPVWDCQLNMPIMPAREGLAEARVSLCCKGPSCAWMGQVRSSTPRQGKRTWSFWDVHPATWNMNCFNLATASILQSQSGVPKVFWLGKQSASREAEMEEQGRLMALVCIIMRNPSISCSVRLHLYNGKLAIAVGHVAVFFCRNLGLSRRMKLQFTLTGWIWCVASWLPLVWVALVATSGVRGCWHSTKVYIESVNVSNRSSGNGSA